LQSRLSRELRENSEFASFYERLVGSAGGSAADDESASAAVVAGQAEGEQGAPAGNDDEADKDAGVSIGLHPKLVRLEEIVLQHFQHSPHSRVIVFTQVPVCMRVCACTCVCVCVCVFWEFEFLF
jgi:hypothetical protein